MDILISSLTNSALQSAAKAADTNKADGVIDSTEYSVFINKARALQKAGKCSQEEFYELLGVEVSSNKNNSINKQETKNKLEAQLSSNNKDIQKLNKLLKQPTIQKLDFDAAMNTNSQKAKIALAATMLASGTFAGTTAGLSLAGIIPAISAFGAVTGGVAALLVSGFALVAKVVYDICQDYKASKNPKGDSKLRAVVQERIAELEAENQAINKELQRLA
jgi:hypothetical protein